MNMWPRDIKKLAEGRAAAAWERRSEYDPNPYCTPGRRKDWERGYNREPASVMMPFPNCDIAYQSGLAYREYEEKMNEHHL